MGVTTKKLKCKLNKMKIKQQSKQHQLCAINNLVPTAKKQNNYIEIIFVLSDQCPKFGQSRN